jgi:hypothetical protein
MARKLAEEPLLLKTGYAGAGGNDDDDDDEINKRNCMLPRNCVVHVYTDSILMFNTLVSYSLINISSHP